MTKASPSLYKTRTWWKNPVPSHYSTGPNTGCDRCPVPLEIKSQESQTAPALGNVTISVVVPVHHGGQEFQQCLQNLSRAEPPSEEVIVVVDGGADGSLEMAEAFGAEVIRLPITGGPARARNHGARAAKGTILLFVDSDVVVSPGVIGKVAAILR